MTNYKHDLYSCSLFFPAGGNVPPLVWKKWLQRLKNWRINDSLKQQFSSEVKKRQHAKHMSHKTLQNMSVYEVYSLFLNLHSNFFFTMMQLWIEMSSCPTCTMIFYGKCLLWKYLESIKTLYIFFLDIGHVKLQEMVKDKTRNEQWSKRRNIIVTAKNNFNLLVMFLYLACYNYDFTTENNQMYLLFILKCYITHSQSMELSTT